MNGTHGRTLGRYSWAATFFGITIVATTLTRVVAFVVSDHQHAGVAALLHTFGVGAAYDTLVAAWLAVPIMLYLTFAGGRRYGGVVQRWLRRLALAVFVACIVFTIAAEIAFFDEFDGRFNFVAVDYLIYPTEVVTNIWQSYPMPLILFGIGAFVGCFMWVVRRSLARFDQRDPLRFRGRLAIAGSYGLILAALTLTITPALSHVSDDRVLNEVASNGYYTFWQALLGRDAPYDGLYATRNASDVTSRLRTLLSAPAVSATTSATTNVVIVLEESLGSAFVSAIHPRDSLSNTPSFDSLASEGMLLTRAYSTGNRTIRAIEATTASLPPLPGISIVRRPQSRNLYTLPAVLRANGYHTEFIYGGRALFDGMGSYVRQNGFERMVEQKDFPDDAYKTAWGVSDEAIFDRALAELDSLHAIGGPFFTTILTVSNHKPYTYPSHEGIPDPAGRRRTSAVRYADWALGRFMRAAASHAFFANTLFVLMGDHGARVYGAAQIPLPSYEVPVLFYMPSRITPGRIGTMASSMDVPPTVLGLLGLHEHTKFFGRDLFAAGAAEGRAVMTHNSDLALMRGNRIAVLGLRGAITINRIDSLGAFHRVEHPDSIDTRLADDAIAYFQGADILYRSGAYTFHSAAQGRRTLTSKSP